MSTPYRSNHSLMVHRALPVGSDLISGSVSSNTQQQYTTEDGCKHFAASENNGKGTWSAGDFLCSGVGA